MLPNIMFNKVDQWKPLKETSLTTTAMTTAATVLEFKQVSLQIELKICLVFV